MAFEAFLTPQRPPSRRRRLLYVVSIALHAAVLVGLGARSLWAVEELAPRGVAVTLLSRPIAPPAPPPPPPAAAKAVAVARPKPKPRVVPPKPTEVVQPAEAPAKEEPAEAEAESDGEPEAPAGEAQGVAGGVVGGVAPAAAVVAAPPADPPPLNISPRLGAGQRISDLNDPQYRPSLPPALNRPGIVVRGLFRVCVSKEGQVTEAKLLSSGDAAVASQWLTVIHRWQYRPLTVDGRPTRFCHPIMIEVQSAR